MRHYNIFLIIIFFQTIFFFSFVKAAIQNSIIVKVGDEIVTSYELESKIKTTLLINGVEFNQTNINRVKNNSRFLKYFGNKVRNSILTKKILASRSIESSPIITNI